MTGIVSSNSWSSENLSALSKLTNQPQLTEQVSAGSLSGRMMTWIGWNDPKKSLGDAIHNLAAELPTDKTQKAKAIEDLCTRISAAGLTKDSLGTLLGVLDLAVQSDGISQEDKATLSEFKSIATLVNDDTLKSRSLNREVRDLTGLKGTHPKNKALRETIQGLHKKLIVQTPKTVQKVPAAEAEAPAAGPSINERVWDVAGSVLAQVSSAVSGAYAMASSGVEMASSGISSLSSRVTSLPSISTSDISTFAESVASKVTHADYASALKTIAPYFLVGLAEYCSRQSEEEDRNQGQMSQADFIKMFVACVVVGHSMMHRITEQAPINDAVRNVILRTASVWSLCQLHKTSFNVGYNVGENVLGSAVANDIITQDTQHYLSLITAAVSTSVVLGEMMLMAAGAINGIIERKAAAAGLGTQRANTVAIAQGLVPEVNVALQIYQYLHERLTEDDMKFRFQSFLVFVNFAAEAGNLSKRLRNVWLWGADNIYKMNSIISAENIKIERDRQINLSEYNVIRDGILIENVRRSDIKVGDLVALSDAMKDDTCQLAGYLIRMSGDSQTIFVSLQALNGESVLVKITPHNGMHVEDEFRQAVDLNEVKSKAAILPGTRFIQYNAEGLYLQIAPPPEAKAEAPKRLPFSAKQISDVNNKLIAGVFAISTIGALALMNSQASFASYDLMLSYYAAEFVGKFTQMFSEVQSVLPLAADVVLDTTNNDLVEMINANLKDDPISKENALFIADLFEFIPKKTVRVISDKTGTITETRMVMRDIVLADGVDVNRIAMAGATTYSAQKIEEEENEMVHFFDHNHGIKITAKAVGGDPDHLEKDITQKDGSVVKVVTKRVGLFTDFGGQFTLREQEGKPPVLVFCGAPKAEDNGDKFKGTPLLAAFQNYEATADHSKRQDSLTRDWSIAETQLTEQQYAELTQAMSVQDPAERSKQIKEIFHKIKNNFEFLGIFQIDNPIKEGARDRIREWNAGGMGFTIATGDTKNAARLIAKKLYPDCSENIYDRTTLGDPDTWGETDFSRSTVILTDTKPETLDLLDEMEKLGKRKPNVIFCQMKDVDKANLVRHNQKNGKFVIANGDGCNDLEMFKVANVAIADPALDGTFAPNVKEMATVTQTQLERLSNNHGANKYTFLDILSNRESKVLQPFVPLHYTQPKALTLMLLKSVKRLSVPAMLGKMPKEIEKQFFVMLGWDAAFIAIMKNLMVHTKDSPMINVPVNKSSVPFNVLCGTVAVAAAQSVYSNSQNGTFPGINYLLLNLAGAAIASPLLAQSGETTDS